jgi:colanic acid biosynthesis glycosyl transferase WcaI
MKILVISQVFYPDNVSVSQHLSDLCFALADRGHEVNVITSRFSYEEKSIRYPDREIVNNVKIKRIWSTGFGKNNIISRLLDFLSFNFSIYFQLTLVKQKSYDIIIGLTAPPLLSYFGSRIAKKKKIKFCYWIMDMQPELAIQSGLIKKDSIPARFFVGLGNSTFNNSDKIIVLDRFMRDYLRGTRGVKDDKISVVPVWPVLTELYSGDRMDNPFRMENKFGDKIVLMYSGNHSYVHPLDTLLDLAKMLKDDERFLFVFVGGGVRKKDVTEFKNENALNNIIQLPYQPREKIHYSLGSSDFQIVILGEGQVGFTHPNKIYGALFTGKPIIYIGPAPSHVTEILSGLRGNIIVNHGNPEELKIKLLDLCEDSSGIEVTGKENQQMALKKFAPGILINEMCSLIENIYSPDN